MCFFVLQYDYEQASVFPCWKHSLHDCEEEKGGHDKKPREATKKDKMQEKKRSERQRRNHWQRLVEASRLKDVSYNLYAKADFQM